jgi:hypothetical protein
MLLLNLSLLIDLTFSTPTPHFTNYRFKASSRISAMSNLTSALQQLEQERTRLASQLEKLNTAPSALNATGSSRRDTMSAAGRARIAAAQRARWAKVKGRKVVSITAHKRRMSPAARRKIAAAQRARWAKWRKQRSA